MNELRLFNSDEYYQFPKELLDYIEHFLSENEANEYEENFLQKLFYEILSFVMIHI